MKIFSFDPKNGRAISKFDSEGASINRILREANELSIACVHVKGGGRVGYHPAVVDQLFLVVSGRGWVTGEDRKQIAIEQGEAALASGRKA